MRLCGDRLAEPDLRVVEGGRLTSFDSFVRERTAGLLRLAVSLTAGDRHQGEDLVQHVLIKAQRRWSTIEELDDPLPYVRRMVVNEYISWRRKWARVIPVASIADRPADVVDHASSYADRQLLDIELRRLAKRQRAVLVLRYFAGMSDEDIAQVLGCSVSTVRSYLSRALATLRTRSAIFLTTDRED
jgi:RNA polymerase sigma-70 factor (sigma-E family)